MEQPQEEFQLGLRDQFLISPLGQWTVEHKNLLINVGTFFLVVLVWGLVQLARSNDQEAVRRAQDAYAAWIANPEDQKLYQDFNRALDKVPSMRRALCGQMAQRFLSAHHSDEAAKLAAESMVELRKVAPLHAEFAATSLLIDQKRYQEALERSVALKEKAPVTSVLYAQNLIRIALLQQMLNNPSGEMAAWNDWEEFSKDKNSKTLREVSLKGLGDPTIRFQSYVEERKKQI